MSGENINIIRHQGYPRRRLPNTNSVRDAALTNAKEVLQRLKSTNIEMRIGNNTINVGFRREGNKHVLADMHNRSIGLNVSDVNRLPHLMRTASYIASAQNANNRRHGHISGVVGFHYFAVREHGRILCYLNIMEETRVKEGVQQRNTSFMP